MINKSKNIIVREREVTRGICPKCKSELKEIWENNGFTEPDGPSHWEVTGYEVCSCGGKDE